MGNICSRICDVMSWILIPFTFGQIEEEEQEEEKESTQDAVQSHPEAEIDQEVHITSRDASTSTRKSPGQYTKYNGLVSSIQLLIVIVVVISVVTLSYHVPKKKDHGSLHLVQISFMVTGLAIMISIYKCQGRFLRAEGEPKESKRDSLVLIGIVTFCALSCLHSFFSLLDCLICSPFWILCRDRSVVKRQLVRVVFHVFRIIYLSGQTVFCMLFNKSTFANTSLARHALMYLQAVNLVFWFSSFIDETVHIFRNQNTTELLRREALKFQSCFPNETLGASLQECVSRNHSITVAVHQYANPILRPFIIEYALLVGESLAHWFLSCGEMKAHRGGKVEDDLAGESRRSGYSSIKEGGSRDEEEEEDNTQSTEENLALLGSNRALNYRPMALVFHVGLAVLSNLLLCVFAFLPHLLNNAGDATLDHSLYKTYYCYYCVHTLFVLLSVLAGYGISSRFKVKKHANFTGLDYMLMFTSAGPLAFNSFKLLATGARNLPMEDHDMIHVYRACRVLELIQVPMQAVFMLYAGRVVVEKRAENLVRRACFRAIVAFLALSNGCLWSIYTFSPGYVGKRSLDTYYGGTSSVVMKAVISPVSLFFRFNSALMFARVFFQTRSTVVR